MLRDYCDSISSKNEYFSETIFPDGKSALSYNVVIFLDDVVVELDGKDFKAFFPYLLTCTTYKCAYSGTHHQTRAAYAMSNYEGNSAKAMGPYQDNWLEKPIVLIHPGFIVAS